VVLSAPAFIVLVPPTATPTQTATMPFQPFLIQAAPQPPQTIFIQGVPQPPPGTMIQWAAPPFRGPFFLPPPFQAQFFGPPQAQWAGVRGFPPGLGPAEVAGIQAYPLIGPQAGVAAELLGGGITPQDLMGLGRDEVQDLAGARGLVLGEFESRLAEAFPGEDAGVQAASAMASLLPVTGEPVEPQRGLDLPLITGVLALLSAAGILWRRDARAWP
jgi:hypothetical protein